jgi:hypothetical protein
MHYGRVIVVFVFFVSCSGKGSGDSQGRGEMGGLQLTSVHWSETGDESGFITVDDFFLNAKEIFEKSEILRSRASNFTIEGKLDVGDEKYSMIIRGRVKVDELTEPLETGVAAKGQVKGVSTARAFVRKGLVDFADAFEGLLSLLRADNTRLIRSLSAAEPDEQIVALKLLGARKVRKAVPEIGRLLKDSRELVVEVAAEVLSQIGDEKAVGFLIDAIDRRDLRSEVRAIEAMGRIGGEEAQAYLEMTAMGHEVMEVRILSKDLLKRIQERTSH